MTNVNEFDLTDVQVTPGLVDLDGPSDVAVDLVPTADQTDPVATYADWRKEDTRIVVCRIATDAYPGERFETRDEAVAAIRARHGRILEANYVPGRAFLRVPKVSR
jgi:hypothetical protein